VPLTFYLFRLFLASEMRSFPLPEQNWFPPFFLPKHSQQSSAFLSSLWSRFHHQKVPICESTSSLTFPFFSPHDLYIITAPTPSFHRHHLVRLNISPLRKFYHVSNIHLCFIPAVFFALEIQLCERPLPSIPLMHYRVKPPPVVLVFSRVN